MERKSPPPENFSAIAAQRSQSRPRVSSQDHLGTPLCTGASQSVLLVLKFVPDAVPVTTVHRLLATLANNQSCFFYFFHSIFSIVLNECSNTNNHRICWCRPEWRQALATGVDNLRSQAHASPLISDVAIGCFDPNPDAIAGFQAKIPSAQVLESNEALVDFSSILVLAVKPQMMDKVLSIARGRGDECAFDHFRRSRGSPFRHFDPS